MVAAYHEDGPNHSPSANGCLIAVLVMSIVVSITLLPHQFGALVLVKEIVKKMMTEDQAIPISKPADKE